MYIKLKIIFYRCFLTTMTLVVLNTQALSQKLQTNIKSFDQLMRDTLATQDAVFEAEKKILSQKQTKKVSVNYVRKSAKFKKREKHP